MAGDADPEDRDVQQGPPVSFQPPPTRRVATRKQAIHGPALAPREVRAGRREARRRGRDGAGAGGRGDDGAIELVGRRRT